MQSGECMTATANERFWQKRTNLVITISCITLLLTIVLSTIANTYTLNGGISHSGKDIVEVEVDRITHKILSCYVQNGALYLHTIAYPTENGPSFEQFSDFTDYKVYYNGKKYKPLYSDRKNALHLCFNLPFISQNRDFTIDLHYNNEYIAKIFLEATNNTLSNKSGRPGCKKNGILLVADLETHSNTTEVRLSAVLPRDCDRDEHTIINHYFDGFAEFLVYIEDYDGNRYYHAAYPLLSFYDSTKIQLSYYHYYYFNLPEELKEFKIVVDEVSYKTRSGESVTLNGPWEIPVIR